MVSNIAPAGSEAEIMKRILSLYVPAISSFREPGLRRIGAGAVFL